MKVETLEMCGFESALRALRLSYGKEPRSEFESGVFYYPTGITDEREVLQVSSQCIIDPQDIDLMERLVRNGDEHAKVLRGIIVYAQVDAPVYWWCEEETYRAGHERLMSESTMHIDCKGLSGEELQRAKAEIPMGKVLRKVGFFSYQCLRNIYRQRRKHRLPEWREFCAWIEGLPLADRLITAGL